REPAFSQFGELIPGDFLVAVRIRRHESWCQEHARAKATTGTTRASWTVGTTGTARATTESIWATPRAAWSSGAAKETVRGLVWWHRVPLIWREVKVNGPKIGRFKQVTGAAP